MVGGRVFPRLVVDVLLIESRQRTPETIHHPFLDTQISSAGRDSLECLTYLEQFHDFSNARQLYVDVLSRPDLDEPDLLQFMDGETNRRFTDAERARDSVFVNPLARRKPTFLDFSLQERAHLLGNSSYLNFFVRI